MNFPAPSSGGEDPSPPRKELNLQGPRPTPLKIRKDSYKIKKPPLPSKPPPPQNPQIAAATATADADLRRDPVIIYAVSPKLYHADASEFMKLVQKLTGPSLSPDDFSGGDFSPAARLASVERVSPRERERLVVEEQEMEVVEVSRNPGILSPAPESFPAEMYAGFFSPAARDVHDQFLNDFSFGFSPVFQDVRFVSSPNYLFSNSFVATPSPTLPYDIFDHNF